MPPAWGEDGWQPGQGWGSNHGGSLGSSPWGCASPGFAVPDEGREMGTGLHGMGLNMAARLVGAAGRSVL